MTEAVSRRSKQQLIEELAALRKRVCTLEENVKSAQQAGELLHIFRINSPICLFVVQDGRFVFANQQFQNILGVAMEQLTGSYSLDHVHPEDKESVREKAILMLNGELAQPYLYRVISRDGRIRWLEEGVVSVQYQGRRAVLGHSLDITDRVKAEAELRRHYERERRLRKKLEIEVNKRIEFTRALVHELKTPLTPILFSSELLVDELHQQPWNNVAQNIHRGASHLNNRIDELLDLARVEIGSLKLNPTLVNLTQLIGIITANMAALFDRYHQRLVVDMVGDLPAVVADAERLQQVVQNLLVNASKFTPEGGTITISARVEGDHFLVAVKDTGIGISKREQKTIFEPYQRRRTDRERLSGLGLGLSLCKKLVELHGGKIWVESQTDQGSTFTFTIPLQPPEKHPDRKPGEKIL
jgi:PAS domain S-box-containing protein